MFIITYTSLMTKHDQGGLQIQDAECAAMISRDHALFKDKFSAEEDPTSGEEEIKEGEKQDHNQGETLAWPERRTTNT